MVNSGDLRPEEIRMRESTRFCTPTRLAVISEETLHVWSLLLIQAKKYQKNSHHLYCLTGHTLPESLLNPATVAHAGTVRYVQIFDQVKHCDKQPRGLAKDEVGLATVTLRPDHLESDCGLRVEGLETLRRDHFESDCGRWV